MKKRVFLLMLAMLLCAGVLCACRPDTPTPPDDTQNPPSDTPGPGPSDPGTDPDPGPDDPPVDPPVDPPSDKYVYPDEEYEQRMDLFGKWEDFFAPGGRSDTFDLTVEQDAGGLYEQFRDAVKIEGVRTYASVDHGYSRAMHLNVDAYIVSPKYQKEFTKAGYDIIGSSGSFNKSNYSLAHPEVLQVNADGSSGAFWGSSVLTYDVVKYNMSDKLRDMVNRSNWSVGFVEPEMFRYGGYGEAYKELWELKYGEEWSDPNGDVRSIFLSQRLNVWTHSNAIKMYASYVNEREKDVEHLYSVAPHSTLAYATYPGGVTDGFVHMMGTGQVETVTGQTWSNTIINPVRYEGESARRTFINAYVEYGTYLDAVNYYGTNFYALCDPMSDTHTQEEESYWRQLCHEQLVASMMYSDINRWELIWTNRSFMNVSPEYRSEQLNIHNALLEISGAPYRSLGGTPGITYLLGDTLTWQSPDKPEYGENAYDGFWGVAAPLVYDGIPLRTMAMELITKPEDLKNVSVLIVSYDNQKPLYEELNAAIAAWVKEGGTLLYLGGPDEYLTIPDAWWNQEGKGGSPTANLLQHLGVADSISAATLTGGDKTLRWLGGKTAADAADYTDGALKAGGDNFTYYYEGSGFETLLETEDGKAVGITFDVGDGTVLMVGLSTTDYSDSAAGADLMRMLTAKATESTEYDYVTSNAFVVERGDYVAVYPLKGDYNLTGAYVNIFSSNLEMILDPVVKEGTASLFLRVQDTEELTKPVVSYAGGFVQSVQEMDDLTIIELYAAENAATPIRIAAPEGMVPLSVVATYENGLSGASQVWDPDTNSLCVQVFSSPTMPVTVSVYWGSGEAPIENLTYESFKLTVNNAGTDAPFLHFNSGGADGSKRYTDNDAEVIWKFNVSAFRGLVVAAQLSQNYVLEVSGDGVNFTEVINYSKISSYSANAGTNDGVACVVVGAYEDVEEILYIRLRNTTTRGAWGGAVKSLTFQYLVQEGETLGPDFLK
ncbi:MAG: hypothetical protein E7605_03070 [Ruminococcaceae bacterium]|nr:hypothetical protein [Oscillospiraceae bacterium]